MEFDLRLLRHARALAEEGSFARAARALHITQPALSRSIRDLESRVGIALFDRARTRVVPTDLGRAFLDRADALLAHAESLEREVALLKGSSSGTLNIGAGTYPAAMFMERAMAAFMADHPGVGVRLSSGNWATLLAMLRRRELDVIVAHLPGEKDTADLDVTPLATRQAAMFVRPGHPLAGRASLALTDIAAYPLATTVRPGPLISERLQLARGEANDRHAIPDFGCEVYAILKAVARATDHVLLGTFATCATELHSGELVALPLIDPMISSAFAILRLRGRTLPAVVERLVAAIVAADHATADEELALVAQWSRTGRRGRLPTRTSRARAAAP